jgi:putative transposase
MNYRRLFVENTMVFLTIVTQDRMPIIIENIEALISAINETKQYYSFEIIAYIFMPDHIHMLLKPEIIEKYPKIIHSIKYNFRKNMEVCVATQTYPLKYSNSVISPQNYKKLFQNRYYEHTIRDENDLYKHLDYIHYNSVKHLNIAPKDWKYSSFKEFVEQGNYELDWCNFNDKHNIMSMNLE